MNAFEAVKDAVPQERRRYSIRKAIEKLKTEISLEDYLCKRGVEVRRGRARCIVHGGDNPQSFSIDHEKQLWHCFACVSGGDLIDLCELVERHADTWTAVVSLSMEFGIDLPERPQRWHDWQKTKTDIRNAAAEARRVVRRERFFKLLVLSGPEFDIEDDEERRVAIERAWKVWETETRSIRL